VDALVIVAIVDTLSSARDISCANSAMLRRQGALRGRGFEPLKRRDAGRRGERNPEARARGEAVAALGRVADRARGRSEA